MTDAFCGTDVAARSPLSKPEGYYSHSRPELVAWIPPTAKRILDIGCGEGAIATSLRASHLYRQVEIVGVEFCEPAAAIAATRLDTIWVGNIETMDLNYEEYFDCVLLADVLEHLVDPWKVLRKIRRYLVPGARVVASIPNVQYWRVVLGLLRGSWEYTSDGILDSTHLRFFTRRSAVELFSDTGFTVHRVEPLIPVVRGIKINRATWGWFESFLAFQYLVVAEFNNDGTAP